MEAATLMFTGSAGEPSTPPVRGRAWRQAGRRSQKNTFGVAQAIGRHQAHIARRQPAVGDPGHMRLDARHRWAAAELGLMEPYATAERFPPPVLGEERVQLAAKGRPGQSNYRCPAFGCPNSAAGWAAGT